MRTRKQLIASLGALTFAVGGVGFATLAWKTPVTCVALLVNCALKKSAHVMPR